MDTILFKYHCGDDDYLVLDTCKNSIALDARAVRTICTRNFGFGSAGILAGAFMDGGKMSLRQYLPDGSETAATRLGAQIFGKYLMDAGYLSGKSCTLHSERGDVSVEEGQMQTNVEEIGKLFLSEAFLSRNHVSSRGNASAC